MKKRTILLLLLLAVVVSFTAGYVVSRSGVTAKAPGSRKILHYVDPMHPAYTSDKPGIAPDCGMPLEPVYADGGPASGNLAPPKDLPPGTVQVSPEKQQLIGVKTVVVEKAPAGHTVRLLGRVTPDESRVYRIITVGDMWVRKLAPPTTGSVVKKDELLLSYYSSQFLPLTASYVYLMDAMERQKATGQDSASQQDSTNMQIRQATDNLKNIGISEYQLREIAKARKVPDLAEVRSPVDGLILVRNVSPGQFVPTSSEIYRIADLSKVWVLVDVFENEASLFKPGQALQVNHPGLRKSFAARVSATLPQLDPATRTLKVRLEVSNPGYALRPDMFVDVEQPVSAVTALTVPADAVLDSGLKKTVFVDRGNGYFEPRTVQTGSSLGDRVEILRGLMPGERIVASGNFLIDSETRLRQSAAGITGTPGRDPVCGMDLDQERARAAGYVREYQGKTYYFCSPECRDQFAREPARHVAAPAAPGTAMPPARKAPAPARKGRAEMEEHQHGAPHEGHAMPKQDSPPASPGGPPEGGKHH